MIDFSESRLFCDWIGGKWKRILGTEGRSWTFGKLIWLENPLFYQRLRNCSQVTLSIFLICSRSRICKVVFFFCYHQSFSFWSNGSHWDEAFVLSFEFQTHNEQREELCACVGTKKLFLPVRTILNLRDSSSLRFYRLSKGRLITEQTTQTHALILCSGSWVSKQSTV